MDSEVKATVTIGMPVYNSASTIRAALDSLLNQTRRDFVLVISDNASTDDTEAICREYVARDDRIRYLRQSTNLGSAMNYRCVLFEAHTPYFMWAPGDDLWAPTFIDRTVAFLEAHPDYVCCQSRVLFTVNGRVSHYSTGTYPLSGDRDDNVAKFFRKPDENGRIYGMFRTNALQAVFPSCSFFSLDYAVVAGTLKFGRHAELREVLMVRDKTPVSNYEGELRDKHRFFLWRMFPLLYMSIYCVRRQFIPFSLRSCRALVRLNLHASLSWNDRKRMRPLVGLYRFVRRIGLRLVGGRGRHLYAYKDSQASAFSATPASASCQDPPDPVLPVRHWQMPAPLADKPVRLAIIIVASDGIDFTLALIDSIAKAQDNIALEIIICDLGIGDITPLLWSATDNIRCIRCHPSLTYAAAANIAVKQATTPIIGFFDQKILVEPGAIRELLKGMSDSVALIGPQALYRDRRLCAAGGIFACNSVCGFGRFDEPTRPIYMCARDVDFCPHAYLVRRELLANLDGFDEAFATFEMAQVDLALRARATGGRFLYWPAGKIVTYAEQWDRDGSSRPDAWLRDLDRLLDKYASQINHVHDKPRDNKCSGDWSRVRWTHTN
jgi:GT2 family glycosyltransferase